MKKILSLFSLLAVLLTASCSLKEDFKGNDSDFATLTFTLGEEGAVTRAIGDGTSVDMLSYAVYDAQDNLIGELGKTIDNVTFPTQVEITLAKGQTYSIVFWAQSSQTDAYTITGGDVRNVTISYTKDNANNDESRDAFFKTVQHTVTGDIALDVTLERPFAQINLGVTQEDWDAAETAGITVTESQVVISKAATKLDLFNGKVSDGEEVTYTAEVIPSEALLADFDKDGVKENYKYLSLSYILVCDEGLTPDAENMFGAQSSLVNTTFTLNTNKKDVVVKVDNLPVRRNWRTNVVGKLLTGDITFNIDVDPIFDGEENYPDTDLERLLFAAQNGGSVKLGSDVELTSTLIVADDKDMVIDLNGHNITVNNNSTELEEGDGIIVYGNLTIKGEGNVTANTRAVWARGSYGAKVRIEGGNYIGATADAAEVIYASGDGVIDIYGGRFEAATQDQTSFAAPQYAVLNLHGNGITGCDINVYGGTFVKFNPSDNVSENPKKDFVEEGCQSIKDGDNYVVISGNYPANAVLVSDKTQMEDLINNATGDVAVILTQDIDETLRFDQKENVNVSIYGNGNKVTETIYLWGHARFNGAETLLIDGVKFVSDKTIDFISSNSTASDERYAHNVTIRNCSFENKGTGDVVAARLRQSYNIVFENCTATGLHSFVQATACESILIDGLVHEGRNGLNFLTSGNPTIKNSKITATKTDGYAIRVDAGNLNVLNVENSVLTGGEPIVFRKSSSQYKFNLSADSKVVTTGTYHIVVASGVKPQMTGVEGLNIKLP